MDNTVMSVRSNSTAKQDGQKFLKSRPNLVLTLILAAVMTISLGVFIGKIMQYNEFQREKAAVEKRIDEVVGEIDALAKEYAAETDDAYIESVAKDKLDLVNPDEVIVYGGSGE